MDGYEPSSPSLPQIGTAQEFIVDGNRVTERVYAWIQWWVRDQDLYEAKGPEEFLNIRICPGDVVSCELVVIGPKLVIGRIKNESTGCYTSTPYYPKGDGVEHVAVEGLSASWVVERPTHKNSDELFKLPNYRSAVFYGCVAATDRDTESRPSEQQLEDAELVEMVDFEDEVDPGVVVSTPIQQSDDSVALFYRDSGP